MTTALLEYGRGELPSQVMLLDQDEVDTLMLVGDDLFAQVIVEIRTDDGTTRDDNEPQFRFYTLMTASDPLSCVVQMIGPIDYRVRRDDRAVDSGCNIKGKNGGAPN